MLQGCRDEEDARIKEGKRISRLDGDTLPSWPRSLVLMAGALWQKTLMPRSEGAEKPLRAGGSLPLPKILPKKSKSRPIRAKAIKKSNSCTPTLWSCTGIWLRRGRGFLSNFLGEINKTGLLTPESYRSCRRCRFVTVGSRSRPRRRGRPLSGCLDARGSQRDESSRQSRAKFDPYRR